MDANTLNDFPIVSIRGAARLGRVKDVLFATDPLRVAALRTTDDWGESIVPFERITSFGNDAVMVETDDVGERSPLGDLRSFRSLKSIHNVKIVDETGAYVGSVKSVHFDPDSGRVDRVVAATGGLMGLAGATTTVEAADLRGFGDDILTISSTRKSSNAEVLT